MPDSKSRRLWLFLDELPQLGKVPEIAQFLEIGRSKGCRVVMGVQDLAQLREIYGKDTIDAWASMVGTYLIARTQGEVTPTWLSRLIKTKKVKKYRISYTREPGGSGVSEGRTDSWEDVEEPVFRPEQFETELGPRTPRLRWKPWKKDFYIEAIYHPGGDFVYKLKFRPVKKIIRRAAVIEAAWINGPHPELPADAVAIEAPAIAQQQPAEPTAEKKPAEQKPAEQKTEVEQKNERQICRTTDDQEPAEGRAETEEKQHGGGSEVAEEVVEELAEKTVAQAVEQATGAAIPGPETVIDGLSGAVAGLKIAAELLQTSTPTTQAVHTQKAEEQAAEEEEKEEGWF
jgi:hypothetical protein